MTAFRVKPCGFGRHCKGSIREPIEPPDVPFESECDDHTYGPHRVTYLPATRNPT